MPRLIVALASALLLSPAIAQQSGSRILTTPEVPQPKDAASAEAASAPTTRTGICDRLEGAARKRCLQEQHEPALERGTSDNRSAAGIESGPGSTGMGSAAGVGASGSGGGGPR
jgi:hypothetical protein